MKEPGIVKKSLFERVYFSESSTIIEKAQNKLNKPIFDENEK